MEKLDEGKPEAQGQTSFPSQEDVGLAELEWGRQAVGQSPRSLGGPFPQDRASGEASGQHPSAR